MFPVPGNIKQWDSKLSVTDDPAHNLKTSFDLKNYFLCFRWVQAAPARNADRKLEAPVKNSVADWVP